MKVHYSSEKQNWETPQDFFDNINKIFNFTLDSCTEIETAKCEKFFTKEEDALVKIGKVLYGVTHLTEENKSSLSKKL